jgi:hypothetical protein
MNRTLLSAAALLVGVFAQLSPAVAEPAPDAILQAYADDFANDPHLDREMTFGIEVGDRWWSVHATPSAAHGPGHVTIEGGRPQTPTFYYTLSGETLNRLQSGQVNALTAMARAHEDDPTPMDLRFMDGFSPGADFYPWAIPLTFHFWTRGQPEIVPFGSATSLPVHGGEATIFFYQPGLRSGFFEIRHGQHVNADVDDQSNPFPTLIVVTRGRMEARIGGRQLSLHEGQSVFIPANTTHEFTNPHGAPAQGILIMFGPGA